jgi:hypothetical protein
VGSEAFVYFVLRDAKTKKDLYESPPDFAEQQPPKFYARTEDPAPYRFVVPADGKYLLLIGSRLADALSGPRHFYRVRLAPEVPDFHLGVTPPADQRPDGAVVMQGGSEAFTVFATRREGFNGDIQLTVEGLPPGVICPPQTIGAGVRQTELVVSAAANAPLTVSAPPTVAELKIKGTAVIRGNKVEHEARPAGVVWPPNQPGGNQRQPLLTRLDRALVLAVRPGAPYALTGAIAKPALLQGDKTDLKIHLTRLWPEFKTPLTVQAQAADLPAGLTLNNNQPITLAPDKAEGSLAVNVGTGVPPGTYNLTLRTSSAIPFNKDLAAKERQPTNVVQPATPVALIVLPKTVATLALANATPSAKPGGQAEVVLRVTRQADYAGDFKVQVVLPKDTKGISVNEVTIPAGKNEGKVVVKVAADAAPGNRAGLIVRATGTLNGNVPVPHEVKFDFNVVKP